MTTAEKKVVLTTTKQEIKDLKAKAKVIEGNRKDADKLLSAATKAHLTSIKAIDKEAAANAAALAKAEAKVAELAGPVAA
jgi:hypothetical protein